MWKEATICITVETWSSSNCKMPCYTDAQAKQNALSEKQSGIRFDQAGLLEPAQTFCSSDSEDLSISERFEDFLPVLSALLASRAILTCSSGFSADLLSSDRLGDISSLTRLKSLRLRAMPMEFDDGSSFESPAECSCSLLFDVASMAELDNGAASLRATNAETDGWSCLMTEYGQFHTKLRYLPTKTITTSFSVILSSVESVSRFGPLKYSVIQRSYMKNQPAVQNFLGVYDIGVDQNVTKVHPLHGERTIPDETGVSRKWTFSWHPLMSAFRYLSRSRSFFIHFRSSLTFAWQCCDYQSRPRWRDGGKVCANHLTGGWTDFGSRPNVKFSKFSMKIHSPCGSCRRDFQLTMSRKTK